MVPIDVEQLTPQYLYYTFSGQITLQDLDALRTAEEPFFTHLPDKAFLGLILDLSDLDTIAAPLFPQLQRMRLVQDPHVCIVVVVGANPYLRALTQSLGLGISKYDFAFRQTVDEALNVLDHHHLLHSPPEE
ncbi:MAG TPA: hypothetical protein VHP83_16920 [Aggregatilineaceae bacterium]|nr:hypothetical protein [Aggregatilineaceae bacterium]